MKNLIMITIFSCAAVILQSCNGSAGDKASTGSDSVTMTDTATDPTNDSVNNAGTLTSETAVEGDAKTFMEKAASTGMLEIEAGRLAVTKAATKRVKAFGTMMIKDHTKAGDELKTIAQKKHVVLPSALMPEEQKHLDMMKKLTTAEFDSHYIKMMAEGHTKVANMFEQTSKNEKDVDVRDFATRTLPVIKMHLDSAKAISKAM